MEKNNLELEHLLKQSLNTNFPLPEDIDKKTQEKMSEVLETKQFRFTTLLITISLLLGILWLGALWHLFSGFLSKAILIMFCLSFSCLSIGSYFINYQSKNRKETESWI